VSSASVTNVETFARNLFQTLWLLDFLAMPLNNDS
jgi:hypothetical protein